MPEDSYLYLQQGWCTCEASTADYCWTPELYGTHEHLLRSKRESEIDNDHKHLWLPATLNISKAVKVQRCKIKDSATLSELCVFLYQKTNDAKSQNCTKCFLKKKEHVQVCTFKDEACNCVNGIIKIIKIANIGFLQKLGCPPDFPRVPPKN